MPFYFYVYLLCKHEQSKGRRGLKKDLRAKTSTQLAKMKKWAEVGWKVQKLEKNVKAMQKHEKFA